METSPLLPIDDVDHARIVPDWDAVMKGGRGQIRTGEAADAAAGIKQAHGKPGAHGKLPHPKLAAAARAGEPKADAAPAGGHGKKRKHGKDAGERDGSHSDGSQPSDAQTTSRARDDDRASD